MKLKHLITASVLTFSGTVATSAIASDYGCEALLCFAGGKNVSECQPTIKRVLIDRAKGKVFPHCCMVSGSSSGGVSGSSEDFVNVRLYNERWRSGVCRDGQTRAIRTIGGYYCKTIEINIKPEYAADPSHQKQFYNWN